MDYHFMYAQKNRQQLHQDVETFLNSGKQIKQIPAGVRAKKRKTRTFQNDEGEFVTIKI